ncbi:TonB family protein [Acinetobacter lanii]|uniref:TonB family protein n=1 Tax=Acinetobacter lanii TaxID=2715163 RepID=A0A6G8S6J9_9GAMM|nr:TonB family protein [Acinetobacter lanii]QIO09772.1 TonB family protein [Acinetobacter lanii]
MKPIFCLSLLLCFASTATHSKVNSKDNAAQQLAVQRSTAEAAHLTTRIQWLKFPQLKYSDADLNGLDRFAIVRVKADESGKVISATVKESTGLKSLDDRLVQAVLKAKTKPAQKNGNAVAMVGYQSFTFNLTKDPADRCQFKFDSKNWIKQQAQQKTPFSYQTQPELDISSEDLNGYDRRVKFSFKADKHGNVKKAKISKGSGRYELDQQVLEAVQNAKVDVPRKYWIYKKSHLKDEIQFKLDECKQ